MSTLSFAFTVFLSVFGAFAWNPAAHAAARPNILFIIVDDLGWRDSSGYGSTFYETPNIDRLAAEGVRFTDAYAAYPRCVPSRFAFMTGKYPARAQGSMEGMKLGAQEASLGRALQEGGYRTFFCGKWHLGGGPNAPDRNGFDVNVAGGAAGATRSHFAPYTVSRAGSKGKEAPILGLEDAPKGEYLADRLTDETLQFIRAHKEGPFFAVLSHYAVHTPIEGKSQYTARYQEKLKRNPPPPGPDWEKESAGQNKLQQDHSVYAAMIQSVDEGVGRLLRALDDLRITDRTVVVLTSDNGGLSSRGGKREMATSNRPLRAGKGHLYEGGIRLPLIVRWPGVTRPGRVTDVPVTGTDYYPSFLEIAGLPLRPRQHLDGVSFVGVLRGESPTSVRALFWHNPAPRPDSTADLFSSAVRVGTFKLLDFYADQRVELYDLSQDPGERLNLMQSMPEKGSELLGKLNAWRAGVGAAMPAETARTQKTKK